VISLRRAFRIRARIVPTAAHHIEFDAPITAQTEGENSVLDKPQDMRDTVRNGDGAPVVRPPIDRDIASERGRLAADIMQSQDSAADEQRVVFPHDIGRR
jgi:hypothetical protein